MRKNNKASIAATGLLTTLAILLVFCSQIFQACQPPELQHPTTSTFTLPQPAHFPLLPINKLQPNPTLAGAQLGKVLFFDKHLSGSNTLSCASCHLPEAAFTDANNKFSKGDNALKTHRNTPALFNLAWQNFYFWDGGAQDLESHAFAPIATANELNQPLALLVNELQATKLYPPLFKKAFGTDSITSQLIVFALAQYERSLVSCNSRYDRFRRKEPRATLTSLELQGLQIVKQKCGNCHAGELFTDGAFHNNGIAADYPDTNEKVAWGRGRITRKAADIGKFKTPSLRNLGFTMPYMHDGRFMTLEKVLEHYSTGVLSSPTLDPILINSSNKPAIELSKREQTAILAFLKTLNDSSFIQNPAYTIPGL